MALSCRDNLVRTAEFKSNFYYLEPRTAYTDNNLLPLNEYLDKFSHIHPIIQKLLSKG